MTKLSMEAKQMAVGFSPEEIIAECKFRKQNALDNEKAELLVVAAFKDEILGQDWRGEDQ